MARSERRSARTLVVDDEPGVLSLICRALDAEGIEVDQASDGEEGLERALTTDYEVVVLDLQLPKVDGITVLRRLPFRQTRSGHHRLHWSG